jgi:acetyl esterase/lipase
MSEASKRPALPVPTSVSEQAQQFLAAGNPYAEEARTPGLDDVDGWLRYIQGRDQMLVERFSAFDFPVSVEDAEIAGVHTYVLRADGLEDSPEQPILLSIHGGGLIMGAGEACKLMACAQAASVGMPVWAPDYRMPPLHPYPAALDDCIAVYRRLVDERAPSSVFVGGASAGGNLAAALIVRAKDEGLPMPAALVLLTPEVDLTESGDTFRTNLGVDTVLGSLMQANLLYANGEDLANPYLSPLFADVSGFPPTLLQAGTRDL